MLRKRTGTLVWRKSGWRGAYWANVEGEQVRQWVDLDTTNRTVARRRLARLVAEPNASPAPTSGEMAGAFVERWLQHRASLGMPCARYERTYWEGYCDKAIGHLPLKDIRPHHIQSILDDAAAGRLLTRKGTRPERDTVTHLRCIPHNMFKSARMQELINANPIELTKVPTLREMKKRRAILADDEFTRFVGCADVDLEL